MTLEELRNKKREFGYSNQQISDLSGLPMGTVQKIFSGKTAAPRYATLKALEAVFLSENPGQNSEGDKLSPELQGTAGASYPKNHAGAGLQKYAEQTIAYGRKRQGEYTLEDYYRIPDDQRVELIDGSFFVMEAPTNIHQLLLLQISNAFLSLITEHGMDCIPFVAPADVQLQCDNKTMLEPDVFIVCDKDKILKSHTYGAPDLVVEVLSPSTRKKDMTIKLEAYSRAGVREYWIVDPDKKKIIVYILYDEMDMAIYGFEDTIPIGISEGKCSLDFSKIYRYVSFLYE